LYKEVDRCYERRETEVFRITTRKTENGWVTCFVRFL
jgi:hypothetical protein